MKVVINKCYGGFHLSQEAIQWMLNKHPDCQALNHQYCDWFGARRILLVGDYPALKHLYCDCFDHRTDPTLIKCVETLKERASGEHGKLVVIEIPDEENLEWEIICFDGKEHITEVARKWY